MGAINVSRLVAGAKRLGMAEWANTRAVGRGAMNLAQTRAPMMMGRATRNMEMLSAFGRTGGMRGMAGVVGSASWKAAAIGAGVGVAGSVTRDASQGNLNRGSFGRALGGGLMGGAVGGMVGAGNLMFRGNVNRAIRAQGRLVAPAAARSARSGAIARAQATGMVGAFSGGGGMMVPPPTTVARGVNTGTNMTRNFAYNGWGVPQSNVRSFGSAARNSSRHGGVVLGRSATAAGTTGMVGRMPRTSGPGFNIGF